LKIKLRSLITLFVCVWLFLTVCWSFLFSYLQGFRALKHQRYTSTSAYGR
jgi:hypothetical protein